MSLNGKKRGRDSWEKKYKKQQLIFCFETLGRKRRTQVRTDEQRHSVHKWSARKASSSEGVCIIEIEDCEGAIHLEHEGSNAWCSRRLHSHRDHDKPIVQLTSLV